MSNQRVRFIADYCALAALTAFSVLLFGLSGCSKHQKPLLLGVVQDNLGFVRDLYSDGSVRRSRKLPAFTVIIGGSPGGAIQCDPAKKVYVFCDRLGRGPIGNFSTIRTACYDGQLLTWTDAEGTQWAKANGNSPPTVLVGGDYAVPPAFRWAIPSVLCASAGELLIVHDPQIQDIWFDRLMLGVLRRDGSLTVAILADHKVVRFRVKGKEIAALGGSLALIGEKSFGLPIIGINPSHQLRVYDLKTGALMYDFTLRSPGFVRQGFLSESTVRLVQGST